MTRWMAILLITLLGISLAINVHLWTTLNEIKYGLDSHNSEPQPKHIYSKLDDTRTKQINDESKRSHKNTSQTLSSTVADNEVLSLESLLETRQFNRLRFELSNALKQSPFDERLLLLEAEMIWLTKPLSIALVHLYDLSELPLSVNALKDIERKITTSYQQAQEQLSKNQQWELLAKLNEPLFQRVPDSRYYALNLARAYAHQRKQTLMEDALASLPFEDAQAQAIRALAYSKAKSNDDIYGDTESFDDMHSGTTDDRVTRVALVRVGDQYRLDAKALNQKAVMILDTGASTTAISSRLYARLGRTRRLTFIGNFNVRTASGTIEAPLVKIPRFYFAGYEFTDVSVIVLPEKALSDTDGLLGMNVLGEFDFAILPQSNELRLKKRS